MFLQMRLVKDTIRYSHILTPFYSVTFVSNTLIMGPKVSNPVIDQAVNVKCNMFVLCVCWDVDVLPVGLWEFEALQVVAYRCIFN